MEMLNETQFELTEETRSLTIKGESRLFPVYRIPVDDIVYNRQNGRIATWVSEYESDNGQLPDDVKETNAIIEKFIVNSNPESFNRTKINIDRFGQNNPAVVLKNGVVVDGNRRFTALRQLSQEKGSKYAYIKAVLLDQNDYNSKDIKTLELNLQHAVEERVDYNPIDRLVDLYRDLIAEGHDFSVSEYAAETNDSEKKIKDDMEVAELLVEYLDRIQQPLMFHIARQQKLDGPIREIYRMLKKVSEANMIDAKEALFMGLQTLDGDVTRKIRDMKTIVQNPTTLTDFSSKAGAIYDGTEKYLGEEETQKAIRETHTVNIPTDLKNSFTSLVENTIESGKIKSAQKAPIEALKKALDRLDDVEINAAKRMNESDRQSFEQYLDQIEGVVKQLKVDVNAD